MVGFRRVASVEVHQTRQAVVEVRLAEVRLAEAGLLPLGEVTLVVAEVRPAEDLLQVAVAVCRAGRS